MDLAGESLSIHRQVKQGVEKGGLGVTPPCGSPEISDPFPLGSETNFVPHDGLPRLGLNSDRPPVPLHSPPREGHNSDPGGGELLSTTIPLMRHVCSLGGLEWTTPSHGYLRKGRGK